MTRFLVIVASVVAIRAHPVLTVSIRTAGVVLVAVTDNLFTTFNATENNVDVDTFFLLFIYLPKRNIKTALEKITRERERQIEGEGRRRTQKKRDTQRKTTKLKRGDFKIYLDYQTMAG